MSNYFKRLIISHNKKHAQIEFDNIGNKDADIMDGGNSAGQKYYPTSFGVWKGFGRGRPSYIKGYFVNIKVSEEEQFSPMGKALSSWGWKFGNSSYGAQFAKMIKDNFSDINNVQSEIEKISAEFHCIIGKEWEDDASKELSSFGGGIIEDIGDIDLTSLQLEVKFSSYRPDKYGDIQNYYLNVGMTPQEASTDLGKAFKSKGWKISPYQGMQAGLYINSEDDIRKGIEDLEDISKIYGCSFTEDWKESAARVFPQAFPEVVPEYATDDSNLEEKVEDVISDSMLRNRDKKEKTDDFIYRKIVELSELTDEAAKNEFIMNFLTLSKNFHNYSFTNRILMLLQNKKVSPFVAGKNKWEEEFGRKVKEGEKDLEIYGPAKMYIYRSEAELIGDGLMTLYNSGIKTWEESPVDLLKKIENTVKGLKYRGRFDNKPKYVAKVMYMAQGNIQKMILIVSSDIEKAKDKRGKASNYINFTPAGESLNFTDYHVYDISQTEPIPGAENVFELPERNVWMVNSNTEDPEAKKLLMSLIKYAEKDCLWMDGRTMKKGGIAVDLVADTGDAGGWSSGAQVAIDNMSKGWRQFSTLIHECAHSMLHFGIDREEMTGQQKEIEAEATAFVVLNYFDYTDTRMAANYLSLHRATGKKVLERCDKIQYAAQKIVEGINKYYQKEIQASGNWYSKIAYTEYAKPIIFADR